MSKPKITQEMVDEFTKKYPPRKFGTKRNHLFYGGTDLVSIYPNSVYVSPDNGDPQTYEFKRVGGFFNPQYSNPFDEVEKNHKEMLQMLPPQPGYAQKMLSTAIHPRAAMALAALAIDDTDDPSLATVDTTAIDAVPEIHEIITVHRTYSIEWATWEGEHRLLLKGAREHWAEREKVASCEGDEALCRLHLATVKPEGHCFCGIHGMKDREKIARDSTTGSVIAECTLYGWVLPHTEGYRAEKGRIEHCWLITNGETPDPEELRLAKAISDQYGVPCETQQRYIPPKIDGAAELTSKHIAAVQKRLSAGGVPLDPRMILPDWVGVTPNGEFYNKYTGLKL